MEVEDLDSYFGHKSTERNIVLHVNNIKDIKLNKNIKSKSVLVLGNERKENIKEETISYKISSRDKKMNNNSLNLNMKRFQLSISSSSSSNMKESSKKYQLPIFDDDKSSQKNTSEIINFNKVCQICKEELTAEELKNNFVGCFHVFCDDCYYNYLKEKIDNNNVEKINCPFHKCSFFLFNNFIERKIIKDILLLKKYKKLLRRKQLMVDPNIQLCPYPDCESYAKKEENNKFVSCIENKHKFCFNCLKDWHNNEECKIEKEQSFEKWKNPRKVKRCPRCKYYIEKNKGCNHITCFNCKYEWCWLCLQEYEPNHFELNGKCFGLQYAKSECFSNRFCIILYQILIFIAKQIAFALFGSAFFFFLFCYFIYNELLGNYYACFRKCLYFISAINIFISLSGILLCLSTFVSILMSLIWPLKDLIFGVINKIF